jgi:hypothetical protein
MGYAKQRENIRVSEGPPYFDLSLEVLKQS